MEVCSAFFVQVSRKIFKTWSKHRVHFQWNPIWYACSQIFAGQIHKSSFCTMMNLVMIDVPCHRTVRSKMLLGMGSREPLFPSSWHVGDHGVQLLSGISSNWREDSRSQFYHTGICARPTHDCMHPNLYDSACSSLHCLIYQTGKSRQSWVSSFPKASVFYPKGSQARLIGFKFLIWGFRPKELGLKKLREKAWNNQEALDPWPSILLPCW